VNWTTVRPVLVSDSEPEVDQEKIALLMENRSLKENVPVDTEAIALKVKQEFAAKEKSKKTPKAISRVKKAA